MFIDTHAHLHDDLLINNIDKILFDCKQNNVNVIISCGTNILSSKKAIELANKYDNIYATVGLHPEEINDINDNSLKEIETLAKNNKVVAIGEIGLDYHFRNDNKKLQQEIFIEQIKLAHKLNLPIIVHNRDSIGDLINILENNKQYLCGGVVHCFNESVEILNRILKLGLIVSYGGVSTFKNANNVVEIIKQTPLDSLMLETDSPYLSPVPYRGEINTPVNIPIIAEKIAEIKNINIEKIAEITTKNAKKLFKID